MLLFLVSLNELPNSTAHIHMLTPKKVYNRTKIITTKNLIELNIYARKCNKIVEKRQKTFLLLAQRCFFLFVKTICLRSDLIFLVDDFGGDSEKDSRSITKYSY